MRKQILIICIYIGELPWYFKFFLKSCSFNKDIDFLILCDQDMTSKGISNNIKIKRYDLQDFKKDVHRSLNINTPIQNGYKLCDFKPAYGYIFSRYIEGYDFWGYCDIDVIFGNIRAFITENILSKYEIITVRQDYLSGCFTLFKNEHKTNTLFMQSKNYLKVFLSEKNFCFDETNFAFDEFAKSKDAYNINTEIESMTHVVLKMKDKGLLKPYFNLHILEGLPGNMTWKKGTLLYKNKYEVLLYHLIFFKDFFKQYNKSTVPDEFIIEQTRITEISAFIY